MSLAAVERLLSEREEAFRAALIDHFRREPLDGGGGCTYWGTYHLRLRNIKVVAGSPDHFTAHLLLDRNYSVFSACDGYVLAQARFEGNGFQIFSVKFLSPGELESEQAAAQATGPAEPSGEFSGN